VVIRHYRSDVKRIHSVSKRAPESVRFHHDKLT